jgi:glyoxylase-like metal-dependent hydrolase (beta-lactamase superfamily II)
MITEELRKFVDLQMTNLKEFRPGLLLTEAHLDDFDVRGAVIIGDKRVVIWDSVSHPADMQPILPQLANKDWLLIYTHADWDHIWGTAGLPFSGLPYHDKTIIGHDNCLARFSQEAPAELREKQMAQPDAWDEVVLVPPTLTFENEFELDLGNLSLHLHHLPGHTRDCIVGFIPEWGILLAGDTVETPLPVINADSPVDQWIEALQTWENDTRVQHVIPAHGMIGGRELLRQNIGYLQKLQNGLTPTLPENLDNFYRETHQQNLRHVKQD